MGYEPLFSYQGASTQPGQPVDTLYLDPHVQWVNKVVQRAEPGVNKFRARARECYRFRDGKQMSDADYSVLQAEQRPANAFNVVQKFLRYISGVQRDSPTALLFNAIDMDNTQAAIFSDQLTQDYNWACGKANTDSERSRAFDDMNVCGMGWVNYHISRAQDQRGLIASPRISPMEMLWPECDRVNLGNSEEGCTRWRARETFFENEEAKSFFGTAYAHNLIDMSDPDSPVSTWPNVDTVPYIIPYVQTVPLDKIGGSKTRSSRSRIMEFQWWDMEYGYVFVDPLDNTEQWMTEDEFHVYQGQLAEMGEKITVYDRQIGRKWQRSFILNRKYLLEDPTPLPGNRFSFNAMCAHYDEIQKLWYGFLSVQMDPQRYANKFYNQMIEINGKQAKGGALVEVTAFEDKAQEKEFLEMYARTGSVNMLADGGIAKFKEKTLPQVAQGTMAVLEFINKSMEWVTGISEESLGMGAGTAAGVTLKRRQRAGMVLLASEFDAETQFRKEEGHIIIDHLTQIADDRLVRVGSMGDGAKVVKLSNTPFSLDYDIEIDEVERDPNMRQWLAELLLGPFGQTAMRTGNWIPEFWNALPIPRTWAEKLKQGQQQKEQQAMQAAIQGLPTPGGRGQKKSLPEQQAIIANKQADTELKHAKAQSVVGTLKNDNLRMILDGLSKQFEERRKNQSHAMDMAHGYVDMTGGMTPNGQSEF